MFPWISTIFSCVRRKSSFNLLWNDRLTFCVSHNLWPPQIKTASSSHWQESRSRKISRRNDSIFSRSLEKIGFLFLFLFLIFKSFRNLFYFLFSISEIPKKQDFLEIHIFFLSISEILSLFLLHYKGDRITETLNFACIFAQKAPVFRPYFYKNLLVWRIGHTNFSSQNLRKEYPFLFLFSKEENLFANFSFSSRNFRFFFNFSFSSQNLKMENAILFLFSKVEKLFANFLFPSQNWRKEFQSSLSLLQIGENNFKFLFLFSIGLFGLSSMTASQWY